MAKEASDIFAKLRLGSGQLRAVSEKRYADAICLLGSGDPQRTNGAMYMAGFAVECLLKALLLDRHPNLQVPVDPATLSRTDRAAHQLLFSHDLGEMVNALPEIEKKLARMKGPSGASIWTDFIDLCEEWTVYARYSPKTAKSDRAEALFKLSMR